MELCVTAVGRLVAASQPSRQVLCRRRTECMGCHIQTSLTFTPCSSFLLSQLQSHTGPFLQNRQVNIWQTRAQPSAVRDKSRCIARCGTGAAEQDAADLCRCGNFNSSIERSLSPGIVPRSNLAREVDAATCFFAIHTAHSCQRMLLMPCCCGCWQPNHVCFNNTRYFAMALLCPPVLPEAAERLVLHNVSEPCWPSRWQWPE